MMKRQEARGPHTMAYLIFSTRQGQEIGRRPLNGPTVVGRSPECDVSLDDGQLSRRHCRLMESPHGWVVSDLGSRNGTRYMGHRTASHLLSDGQVIQIGSINLIFRAGDMLTGEEPQRGLARPKRPANPFEAPAAQDDTAVTFRHDTPPSLYRDVEGELTADSDPAPTDRARR